jgi:hypothetical protein
MTIDDRKHSEPIKAWFTERELIDLTKLAAREDRKLSEMIRVIVRRHMYGNIGPCCDDSTGANSPEEGRTA